ncbi:serine/threonine protein kinase [Actinocorallia herbida]|uniref:non-specific serine/threonine protein kinase n=1 Tax=Actinocorallia herbida TaxID=58109 RepID=A0A3N1D6Q7_9ACTN|nr:serine/threonine-protein kinase [Actinocorallia herbida]ROO89215.1 serine/threonine protein kinase [Actinocorallia herbida]
MAETRVAGRFTLRRELGRGGMGVVWLADDERLARKVALKEILTPAGIPEEEAAELRERLLREGRAAARVVHAGAAAVYDVLLEDSSVYMVMEYVEGRSLDALVTESGPLPPERAARICLLLLEALAAAHACGVVHRDVKPANVLVTAGDRVKLVDFGIALAEGDTRLTRSGAVIGSPGYMAPEQLRGTEASAASDLWALGATLYFAVEGRDAFTGPTFTAIVANILEGAPAAPAHAGPLEGLLAALLRKDPAARPTAAEVQPALADAGRAPAEPLPAPDPRTLVLPAAPAPRPASPDGPFGPPGQGGAYPWQEGVAQPNPGPSGPPVPWQAGGTQGGIGRPVAGGPPGYGASWQSGWHRGPVAPFTAGVRAWAVLRHGWSRLVRAALICFIGQAVPVVLLRGDDDADLEAFPVVALLVWVVWAAFILLAMLVRLMRTRRFQVGPQGMSVLWGSKTEVFDWRWLHAVGVRPHGFLRARAVMVRRRARSWTPVCYLSDLDADPLMVQEALAYFAGPLWTQGR